ncbi:MAG: phosphoribosylaminoimidazolesuccinocarboxamide synthase [Granulosicoccaceae bacterium]
MTDIAETNLQDLELIHRGKVRDVYAIDEQHLLMIATDRVSAFDVVFGQTLPGKGQLLTEVALFWFEHFSEQPNHLADLKLEEVLPNPDEYAQAVGRSMLCKRLRALPIEAVVRGYVIGSGWLDYQNTGAICGHQLPAGLEKADKLATPIFTPATKADVGDHDENIDFERTVELIGRPLAEQVRDTSISLYQRAADYAAKRGIIIADTKFEFGLDDNEQLVLMDEVLTPDSSRFWPADAWRPGRDQPSFDKQILRDYLNTLDWDKTAPGPDLPSDILERTLARYREARDILTQG